MELRHLRYFCAVAELRSFTAAARQLNVSQSGVSGQVRDLEKEIGVSLLRRGAREVLLTPEGVAFLAEAREILAHSTRAVELALLASRGESGALTVGLCGPVTASFLPKAIRLFRKRFPAVALALREYAPSAQVEALLERKIDVGFARSIPSEVKHLVDQELLFREPLIVALPKAHPLTRANTVTVKQLATERLILFCREASPEIFDSVISMCRKARFSPTIADTPSSWQSVLTLVESDEGLGVVPRCVQFLRANDVVFRPMEEKSPKLDVLITWRRNEPSALKESFLELVRAEQSELASSR